MGNGLRAQRSTDTPYHVPQTRRHVPLHEDYWLCMGIFVWCGAFAILSMQMRREPKFPETCKESWWPTFWTDRTPKIYQSTMGAHMACYITAGFCLQLKVFNYYLKEISTLRRHSDMWQTSSQSLNLSHGDLRDAWCNSRPQATPSTLEKIITLNEMIFLQRSMPSTGTPTQEEGSNRNTIIDRQNLTRHGQCLCEYIGLYAMAQNIRMQHGEQSDMRKTYIVEMNGTASDTVQSTCRSDDKVGPFRDGPSRSDETVNREAPRVCLPIADSPPVASGNQHVGVAPDLKPNEVFLI